MASLKDLRVRINSVRQTQKITSAMKLVAASKLRRAQEAAEAARPFSERMERMVGSLAEIMGEREDAPAMLRGTGKDDTHLFVVATANRGSAAASTARSRGRPARASGNWASRARRPRSSVSGARAASNFAASSAGRSSTIRMGSGVPAAPPSRRRTR